MSGRQIQQAPALNSTAASSETCKGAAGCNMLWYNVALTVAVPLCRGGLILYRTQLPAGAVRNGGLLDVSAPVHDYAKVGQSSATFWPRQGGSQACCVGQKLLHKGHTSHGQLSYMDASPCRGSFSGHCNAAQPRSGLVWAPVASWQPGLQTRQIQPCLAAAPHTAAAWWQQVLGVVLKCTSCSTTEAGLGNPMAAGPG